MTIVLSEEIYVQNEMLVYLLGNSEVHAIADPCRRQRIIENLIGNKAVQIVKFQRMLKLHAVSVLHKVRPRRM